MMERQAKVWGERENLVCPICKKSFNALKSQHRIYCSRACFRKARYRRIIRKCLVCGKKFEMFPHQDKKYCSSKCVGISRRSGVYWKNKKRYMERKYINGQIVLVHRYLMEKKLGRELTSHEIVHHIDMDNQNNDISNLYLCSGIADHMKTHKSIEELVKEFLEDRIITFMDGKYVYTNSRSMGREANNI